MNTILVVDDEKPAREELRSLIENAATMSEIIEAKSGQEALRFLQTRTIEVAFIDVNLGDMNGIALAKEALNINHNLKIIFSTAYDTYAVKAFELDAVDYIMKPYEQQRVEIALQRVQLAANPDLNEYSGTSADICRMAEKLKKLSLWKGDRVIPIDIDDIVFLAMVDRNCRICTINDEFFSHQTLGYFQEKLKNNHFYRINRSFLVNLDYIIEIQPWFNNSYRIKVKNYPQEEIIISRNIIKDFRMLLDF
ncbi:MAG TPA: hypothetical protein DDW65_02030 [Firmicutes bacterium]|jgi:two-component system, LytTR family, response regulator LytT|nr:hypothetical protein [Bacillota bacterium]